MPLRKAIWIRLLIYTPLLGFFGWRAYQRWHEEQAAAAAPAPAAQVVPQHIERVTMPDGTVKEIPVVTPEQAKQLWGVEPRPTAAAAAAKAE
jgi:hypothetical protein